MIYLASPYTHKDKAVVNMRYNLTVACVAKLLNEGKMIYSPIVHCHVVATEYNLPTDYLFWKCYNEHFMDLCSEMLVLCIDGWKESKGVTHEIEYMMYKNKNITYLEGID